MEERFIKDTLLMILSKKRFDHVMRVVSKIKELSSYYEFDLNTAVLAGYLHDYTKEIDSQSQLQIAGRYGFDLYRYQKPLWHAFTAALMYKNEFNYEFNEKIYESIMYHTMGNSNLSNEAKIVWLSDYIEDGRVGDNFKRIRNLIPNHELDYVCFQALLDIKSYLESNGNELTLEGQKMLKQLKEKYEHTSKN